MRNPYSEMGVENILLVEDDPWSINSLTTFFQIVGCRMQSAVNAKEAISAMSRDRFDLILCEYQIQDVNGLTLLKMLGDIHPRAVKFLFTSYPVEKLAGEAARIGIDEVIRKPFTMERLEESLKRCFPRGRQGGREPVGAG
ncbi:MAG: response regulator receiver protein [Deltaproteobacteria bacterium]|nr:response regulator receiver protein [Deltaproteobacteria bacterium]